MAAFGSCYTPKVDAFDTLRKNGPSEFCRSGTGGDDIVDNDHPTITSESARSGEGASYVAVSGLDVVHS